MNLVVAVMDVEWLVVIVGVTLKALKSAVHVMGEAPYGVPLRGAMWNIQAGDLSDG
jgi:hypothetical protein